MKAIFASKLYRTSSRRSELTAAIDNPVNAELVMQLRKYLDPEYQKPEYFGQSSKETELIKDKETEIIDDSSESAELRTEHSPAPPVPSHGSDFSIEDESSSDEIVDEENADSDLQVEDEEETELDESEESEESASVEESIQVSTQHLILACHEIDSEVIKGTLNSREDSEGVSRIVIKNDGSELWIYYKDAVNLNSVMESVIALLENTGYSQLMFSRLARTDNAIVFDIVR